jgi:hypothetical protein
MQSVSRGLHTKKIRALAEVQELPRKGRACFNQLSLKFSLITDCEAFSSLNFQWPYAVLTTKKLMQKKENQF